MVSNGEESQVKSILSKYDNILDFYSYYMQPRCKYIGLTLEQFWDDDPELYFRYLEAYNEEKQKEFEEKNLLAYIQAAYFNLAIAHNLQFSKTPKKIFPDKPFDLGLTPKKEVSIEESNEAWLGYFNKMLK